MDQFDPEFFLLTFTGTGPVQLYYKGVTFLKSLLNTPRYSMNILHFELLSALPKLWQFLSLQFPGNCSFLLDVFYPASWGLNTSIYSLLFSQINVDFCSLFEQFSHLKIKIPATFVFLNSDLLFFKSARTLFSVWVLSPYTIIWKTPPGRKPGWSQGPPNCSVLCCILSNI